jgi:hypothetical protein
LGLIEDFFCEIDSKWEPESPRVTLRVIGSGALMLQKDYVRGTKDSDILETLDLGQQVQARLLSLAGKGSDIHQRRKLYLDLVPNGIPFLPHPAQWKEVPQLASLVLLRSWSWMSWMSL